MENQIKILLVKYLHQECNPSEMEEVELWLNKSDENKKYFHELEKTWKAGINVEKYFKSVDLDFELQKFQASIESKVIHRKQLNLSNLFKIAASILLVANVGLVYSLVRKNLNSGKVSFTEMVVPNGSKSRVTLPDGSTVWLNSGSKLRYESGFAKKIREVMLEGEGYFVVAKDKTRPFVVKTSKLSIKALGTEFNIKSYPNEGLVETTLVKGLVLIHKENDAGSKSENIILKPNQKMTFIKKTGKIYETIESVKQPVASDITTNSKSQSLIEKPFERKEMLIVNTIDTDPVIAWKSDKLVFENAPFSEVIVKLERWFGVEIILNNDLLLKSHYTGRIENETLNDVLEIIRYTMPFDYKVEHKKIFIRKKSD